MLDVDPVALLAREVLRERGAALVAEACAWSVGLSDRPHHVRRHGRTTASGSTLGVRAAGGLALGGDEDGRLELGDAAPGTFQDALNALTPQGRLYAEEFDQDVLVPFALAVCVEAAERFRAAEPAAWRELLDDTGEDDDPEAVVRVAEWETPVRTDAEQLVLAALGPVPLVEVEAEGLPLSLVRAAEAELRRAAAPAPPAGPSADELSGALFLAEAALSAAELPVPVPPQEAGPLLEALLAEGIEPEEVLDLLPHLPVQLDTADEVARRLAGQGGA